MRYSDMTLRPSTLNRQRASKKQSSFMLVGLLKVVGWLRGVQLRVWVLQMTRYLL